MPFYTQEHTVTSKRGWKRPLYTSRRVYRTFDDAMRRVSWLSREYGAENVVSMPKKSDPSTQVVYVRLY